MLTYYFLRMAMAGQSARAQMNRAHVRKLRARET